MKAHELLSDESKWTKGAFARTAAGLTIDPHQPSATCFCLNGAIRKAYGDRWVREGKCQPVIDEIVRIQGQSIEGNPLAKWNDAPERTFQEVRDLLVKLDI